jgi:hypothetical protein
MHEYFLKCLVRDRQQRILKEGSAASDARAARKAARAARRAARHDNVVTVRPQRADVREQVAPLQRPTFDDAA